MVKKRTGSSVNGLVILDKPIGLSSNQCLQKVKHLLGAAKAGHTGSLDPLASGVLPLCFGEATKISQFLLDSDKKYQTIIKLGVSTTTGDSEGVVVSTSSVPKFTVKDLEEIIQEFEGDLIQEPSIYSALKQNGVPLYKLARAGKKIEPKFRQITIYYIKLLSWVWPNLELEVSCSKGTYIRTLAEDIGKKLVTGAHVISLRRLKAGPFALDQSYTIEQLQEINLESSFQVLEKCLLATDMAILEVPVILLNAEQTICLRQGKLVKLNLQNAEKVVRVYFEEEFIGLAEMRMDGNLAAKRLMQYMP